MKKSTKAMEVKGRIIEVTIELIQASNGNAAEITTRDIAEKAEVGNGLINYHFQTKENLIAICVQRIVGQVVDGFKPAVANMQNHQERIAYAASQVFEFLFANPAISRISILGDLSEPATDSNTVKSQQSICHVLGDSIHEEDKQIFSFVLGTLLVLIGAIIIWFQVPYSLVKKDFQNDMKTLIAKNQIRTGQELFAKEDFSKLPSTIQKYIENCGYIDTPKMSYMKMQYIT